MSKKFRLLMVLVLVTGLFGGLLTGSTVSADPTPGTFIEIPRIDVGDVFGTGDWDTQIQIMNLGADAMVYAEFYGGNPYLCPPNEDGPFYDVEMWMPAGAVWTLHNAIPAGAESAFIWSDSPLAVTVDRWGPDAYGDGFELSASYTGISDPFMTDPNDFGAPFEYFAPYVMNSYHNLDATITIQNSGEICASIWIHYKEQGNCEFMKAQHVEQIAPGERIVIGNGPDADMPYPTPEIDAPWLGSAYITANVPLAIIVDQLSFAPSLNLGTLLSMRGMPYLGENFLGVFPEIWYADLLYREISGWQSSIQVQNLTQWSLPTFVTVEFFDQSGDSILFVGDWICRNGAKTFYLPAIIDLGVSFPFGYVGAAEIMSHGQVDYPGETHPDGEPIFAVVDIKKTKVYDDTTGFWRHTVAGETQAGSYNAHPYWQKVDAEGWAMPYIAKEQLGVTSRIAIRNNANCNKIKGYIEIVDETGTTVTQIPVPWLHPKHMKVIDLAYFGQIARGFVGAAYFWVDDVEQLCDVDPWDGVTDWTPIMPSVVVLNYGYATELPIGSGAGPWTQIGGDVTRVYEATPFYDYIFTCYGDVKGNVYSDLGATADPNQKFPLDGAVVEIDTQTDTTDSTGWYRIEGLAEGLDVSITASKSGFATCTGAVDVPCNDQVYWNPELRCQDITWTILVTQEDGANPVYGADVTVTLTTDACVDEKSINDMTNSDGIATFSDALLDGEAALQTKLGEHVTVVVMKDGYDTKTVKETDTVFALDDFYNCPGTVAEDEIELCGYFSIYGVVKDAADNPHNGYTVQAETENTGTVLGSGMSDTCCSGNYALSGSIAECTATGESGKFYLRTYAPNGVLVNESALYTCDADGDLGVQCSEVQLANIVF